MRVGLVDVDGHNFPNFALMKISAWHKSRGDSVEWFMPLYSSVDKAYASKVFSFTPDYGYFPEGIEVERGGTGYDVRKRLPEEVDAMAPDYSIYPGVDYAVGFLSRGCIRKCPWCVVPVKEGGITECSTVDRVACGRRKVVFMDNNFLACSEDFVRDQLGMCVRLGLRIDFNQALDCRLVNARNAGWLSKCRFMEYMRFACDTDSELGPLEEAVRMVKAAGYTGRFFSYVLCRDFDGGLRRIEKIMEIERRNGVYLAPFAMVYRDFTKSEYVPDKMLTRLANWCNRPEKRKTSSFLEYSKSYRS